MHFRSFFILLASFTIMVCSERPSRSESKLPTSLADALPPESQKGLNLPIELATVSAKKAPLFVLGGNSQGLMLVWMVSSNQATAQALSWQGKPMGASHTFEFQKPHEYLALIAVGDRYVLLGQAYCKKAKKGLSDSKCFSLQLLKSDATPVGPGKEDPFDYGIGLLHAAPTQDGFFLEILGNQGGVNSQEVLYFPVLSETIGPHHNFGTSRTCHLSDNINLDQDSGIVGWDAKKWLLFPASDKVCTPKGVGSSTSFLQGHLVGAKTQADTAQLLLVSASPKEGSLWKTMSINPMGKVVEKHRKIDWSQALQTFGPVFCQDAGCTSKRTPKFSLTPIQAQAEARAFATEAPQGLSVTWQKKDSKTWGLSVRNVTSP